MTTKKDAYQNNVSTAFQDQWARHAAEMGCNGFRIAAEEFSAEFTFFLIFL